LLQDPVDQTYGKCAQGPCAYCQITATATDACGTVDVRGVDYDCHARTKKGKRIDKTCSCQVVFGGDTITALDSGDQRRTPPRRGLSFQVAIWGSIGTAAPCAARVVRCD
jgi:hypothetical protein